MSRELTRLRVENNLKAADIVDVVKKKLPSFDKSMLSKAENGDRYGIAIKSEIMDIILTELAPEQREVIKRRIRGGHIRTHKVQARLDECDYTALQQLKMRYGYKTTQDLLTDLIQKFIKEQNND